MAYLRKNYMFRPLFRPSSGSSIIPYKAAINLGSIVTENGGPVRKLTREYRRLEDLFLS
jgi:hypothetical protein